MIKIYDENSFTFRIVQSPIKLFAKGALRVYSMIIEIRRILIVTVIKAVLREFLLFRD